MTSILISSDDSSVGEATAKRLASSLGYEHLGRPFLKTVADNRRVEHEKLLRALNLVPTSWSMLSKATRLHLAHIQNDVLSRLLDDGMVSDGLGAHLYARGVSHIVTVRVLSNAREREERVAAEKGISVQKAQKEIGKEDANRLRWSKKAFSLDESDASLYDMVLSLSHIGTAKVVDVIRDIAKYRKFRPMSYSRKCLQNLALESELRVALLSKFSDFDIVANGGTVTVHVKCSQRQKAKTAGEIKVIANEIPNIKFVKVHAVNKLVPLHGEADLKSKARSQEGDGNDTQA